MRRNIKITEEQYRMLQESSEDMFPYVTDSDAKPFNGYGDILMPALFGGLVKRKL